ncbi:PIG-L family deacetylase [Paenibacillus arenilitoris]|uniref:PIG-L family deacetylase n=1 Tax=Paenibacillus arenilitoris TaxID=2772299 RepID=A0A927CMH3_9BACL|nr:PIG-L family deacetylase [Paenibacillus arenilitoris]MBD2869967.1 PIG-L family deacetylase [Paenibacillus arenilitoris]
MDLTNKRILGLFAHPDDETFICGGSLAHFAKRGAKVTVVSATKGEMGRRMGNPPLISRESMPQVREEELREACRRLGIEEPVFLGIRDKTVEYEDEASLIGRLASIVADDQPDVVLTFHPVWGGHPDHCAIGSASEAAVAAAAKAGRANPALYYLSFGDPLGGINHGGTLRPHDVVRVDVSDSLREKLLAFRAHRSQTEMDAWVWQPDRQALNRFNKHEFFIAAGAASVHHSAEWFGEKY